MAGRSVVVVALALCVSACGIGRAAVSKALGQALASERIRPDLTGRLCGARPGRDCATRVDQVVTDLRAFYEQRENKLVWVDGRRPRKSAQLALAALGRARDHGLDPERYGAAALGDHVSRLTEGTGEPTPPGDLATLEADLTGALLALGWDVAIGRPGTPPGGAGSLRRQPPLVGDLLSSAVNDAELSNWPDAVRPAHPQYASLQHALASSDDPRTRRTLAINLERWRWMPDDLGARHIIVNVPSFHMWVFENGNAVLDSKVIVGKVGDETPVFSANMTTVVFSPYWNIPESIAEGETVPSIIGDPNYLSKSGIEVLRRTHTGVERVDPASVNWNDPSETDSISLRQRPGPGNALGNIKFLLPNRFNVYLHDTPSLSLFSKRGRAFSHGCVRVNDPAALARYLLADEAEWTDDAIKQAMHSGDERSVPLEDPVPVHIVYFTAWATPGGTVAYPGDVYGLDRGALPR